MVISTSFLVYHNQRKRLLSETRKISGTSVCSSTLRPYDVHCQFSNDMVQRLQQQQQTQQQQEIINSIAAAAAVNHRSQPPQQHIRLNSNLSQSSQSQVTPPLVGIQHCLSSSQQMPPVSVGVNNPRNSIRKTAQQQHRSIPPVGQQHVSSTSLMQMAMTTKPDIVTAPMPAAPSLPPPPPPLPPVINSNPNVHLMNSQPPTVVSSIYTHSNSENYTDNYSNILASAEHYDLENASSIAPSDIDIVYHYKGYRNRDRIGNIHHNLNSGGSQTSKGHHHAPLSRLSPSVSELSSAHPHILTLHDLRESQATGSVAIPPPQPPIMNHRIQQQQPLPPQSSNNNKSRMIDDEIENNSYGAYSVYTGVGGDSTNGGW